MRIDHVALWVRDPRPSLAFYVETLGLEAVRADAWARGEVAFPSVRVDDGSILDLMDVRDLESMRRLTGGSSEAGGGPLNHLCLSLTEQEFERTTARIAEHGLELRPMRPGAFGARGGALHAAYVTDPDGNVIELRCYAPDVSRG